MVFRSKVDRLAAILKNVLNRLYLGEKFSKSLIYQLLLDRFSFALACCIATTMLFKKCPYSLSL